MWSASIFEEFEQMKSAARLGGGPAYIEQQHQRGKLTARERLDLLFDAGSFHEMYEMVESRATDFGMDRKKVLGDGVVGGYGTVNGRITFAISQDFTVCGGAGGEEYALKIGRVLEKAIETGAPFVNLNDSGGARIEEGICSLSAYSRLFYLNTLASGVIPQIAVIMGPCAGGASYSPALCDFILMVDKTSQMYITGPQVIRSVTGQVIDGEELGGADVHMKKSGNVHLVYPGERECIDGVKALLEYLPQNNTERPKPQPEISSGQIGPLCNLVPENQRTAYDVKAVIAALTDQGSFLELQSGFAPNMVVGFIRINGDSVGIIANQPNFLGGSIDVNAADKASRFIRVCDCFNIPLLSLVDVPAFMPGVDQEHIGIIRHGAKLLYAFAEATVPKICLIMRKAYGGAYCAMNSKSLGADIVYAWPIAQIAVMGDGGAVNIIFKKQIHSAEHPELEEVRLTEEYKQRFMNPYFAAKRGFVDEVIHPENTREKISSALNMLKEKQVSRPWKKHGNIPL